MSVRPAASGVHTIPLIRNSSPLDEPLCVVAISPDQAKENLCMSDSSPGNPVSNRQVTVKTLGEVIAEEHAQLLVRRKNAEVVLQPESEISGKGSPQDNDADIDWMKDTLTGVALSGGGVRSGAISLGFLMGLAKCNALRLVDYLSTVSGGGYAGAVLSAEAERLNRLKSDTQQKDSFAPLFEDSQCPSDSASTHAGCPRRLQRLVSQSNYLIKNKGWASRAAFGVVALGTLLVSALICVAALMAYLFRDLHTPEIYDYLHCLGLRGDLWVAMLPACLVFVVWITFWALSFVLHRRQAEGVRAKYVFFALIATTLAGVTLVATTGDVDFGDFLVTLGFTDAKWNALGEFGNWFKAAVLTAICASLLPYFKPSALLQSGREKREGGKRMLFRIARNGLLFGVPLLFFSFFARADSMRADASSAKPTLLVTDRKG